MPRIVGMTGYGLLAGTELWVVATSHPSGGRTYAIDFTIAAALIALTVRSYWTSTVVLGQGTVLVRRMFLTRRWPLPDAVGFTTTMRTGRRARAWRELTLRLATGGMARLPSIRWPDIASTASDQVSSALNDALQAAQDRLRSRDRHG